MCDMICLRALSDLTDTITVNIPFKIARNKSDKNVATMREDKDYRIVYSKCVIVNNLIPYLMAFKIVNTLF